METVNATRRSFTRASFISLVAAAGVLPQYSAGQAQEKPSGTTPTRRKVIEQDLPGEPKRTLTLVEVTYPPGAGSPPHLHANGVMAFVVSGAIASRVDDGPEQTFRAGDAWWERPGAIHRVSRNASTSEPATLLAMFVAPTGASAAELTKPL
ncbi:MAG TPA: cupin domain-containing protein [Burkholderiales bacterium]|nr:cupin domain-containing protein [Burkholderiales bacterium]